MVDPFHGHRDRQILYHWIINSGDHMKTLVYETNFDSRAALCDRIFAAADHIRNHPRNISSATESLLIRAENCLSTGGGHFKQVL